MRGSILTNTPEETTALGEKLGRLLKPGDVVALFGDLGAGKTTLTTGIAVGLGLDTDIHSPTFTIIHEHSGSVPLYHVDLYRLDTEDEVENLGLDEYIHSDGVTIIEWADRMKNLLPPDRLDIELRMTGDTERRLVFESRWPGMQEIIQELCSDADSGS